MTHRMSDNDAETLTENELDGIADVISGYPQTAHIPMGTLYTTVERILTAHVAAVRASERERLATEVEHWKHHAKEAGDGFTQVCRDYARSAARVTELKRQVRALADAEAERAEDLRDDHSADVARQLRALVDTPDSPEEEK